MRLRDNGQSVVFIFMVDADSLFTVRLPLDGCFVGVATAHITVDLVRLMIQLDHRNHLQSALRPVFAAPINATSMVLILERVTSLAGVNF